MNVEPILRVFLPVFLAGYLLITYTLNIAAFIRRYGVDPRVTQPSDRVLYLCQQYRDAIFISIIIVVAVYALSPPLYREIFVPIPYLEHPASRVAGALLMLLALVLTRLAQHQLGAAWRIGIDRSRAPTDLVTTGLFRLTRNPIALGMIVNASGLFLALPNALTFALLAVSALVLQVRILHEEEHLVLTHGAAYEAYRARTPRWLGRSLT